MTSRETLVRQASVSPPAAGTGATRGGRGPVLIVLSFPHQLLHAVSAVHADRVPSEPRGAVYVWSYSPRNHWPWSDFRKTLRQLVAATAGFDLVMPGWWERVLCLSTRAPWRWKARWLAYRLRRRAPGTVYFSHDASSDHTAQAVMAAFPRAERVCYGDPPGFLHDETPGLLTWQRAWLAVPMDIAAPQVRPIGTLPDTLLRSVNDTLRHALASRGGRAEDCRRAEHAALVVTGNFASSGMMSVEREVMLYNAAVGQALAEFGAVHVKLHAGMSRRTVEEITRSLGTHCPQAEVLTPETTLVSAELLPQIAAYRCVLSFSSASVLLQALYGGKIEVRHLLDDEMIETNFHGCWIDYMKRVNEQMIQATSTLKSRQSLRQVMV